MINSEILKRAFRLYGQGLAELSRQKTLSDNFRLIASSSKIISNPYVMATCKAMVSKGDRYLAELEELVSTKTTKVIHILARSKDGVIGVDDTLPWQSTEDMHWFRENTMGQVCVIGRVTHSGITKPLKDRDVIVVTRSKARAAEMNRTFSTDSRYSRYTAIADLDNAMSVAKCMAKDLECNVMVVGGRSIYTKTLNDVDEVLLSTIDVEVGEVADKKVTRYDWKYHKSVTIKLSTFPGNVVS